MQVSFIEDQKSILTLLLKQAFYQAVTVNSCTILVLTEVYEAR